MEAIGLPGRSRRMREISLFVTFLFFFFPLFRFFTSPTGATVDRFLRPIHQTTRFRARKCLLGVLMMNFHIYSLFSPQIWKFALRPMATSNDNNSGIFKDRSELFVPKVGFSGSGNLMASPKFASAHRPLKLRTDGGQTSGPRTWVNRSFCCNFFDKMRRYRREDRAMPL